MANKETNKTDKNIWYYRKEIGVGILLIISALFMIQNSQEVKFWFFSTMKVRLIFILLLFFILGALTVWVYHFINSRDKKKEIKRLKNEMVQLKDEVKSAYQKLKGSEQEKTGEEKKEDQKKSEEQDDQSS